MNDHKPEREFDGWRQRDGVPLSDKRVERGLRLTHEIIGRKWSLPIIFYLLRDGPLRFNELADRIDGISSKILADNLSYLESNGIIDRTVVEEEVRVNYSLTDRGHRLQVLVSEAITWGTDADTEQSGPANRY